jgi:hypothetical protein
MSKSLDDYGYFGPAYSFADAIPLPGQIGVRKESSIGAIVDAVSGVNYYVDTIAFGGPTFFDDHNPQPMGIRYFLNTEMRCSNGATMSQYNDGVTRGDLLGDHVAAALQSAGLPGLKGLAPGMLENARDALDPRPILAAATATGYPVCQQVQCPVGDVNGVTTDPQNNNAPFIVDPTQLGPNGLPTQTRWVQAYDATGSPINITKDEFAATAKCYNPDGTFMTTPPPGCQPPTPVSIPGTAPYGLCTVVQQPTMPPTLQAEGFVGSEDDVVRVGAALAIAILGGVALWAMRR